MVRTLQGESQAVHKTASPETPRPARHLPLLCNNSSDKAWASAIAEYELAGEHSVHYNLPLSQQAAVEKYLGVRHYPTYILFDQNGKMLPGEFKPYDMDAVRNKIEELTNTK